MTGSKTAASDALPPALHPNLLHSLRTPLNQIIGYTEMLIEQAQEEGQTGFVPDLRNTHAAGKELLKLINNFNLVGPVDTCTVIAPPSEKHLAPLEQKPAGEAFPPSSTSDERASQGYLLVVDDNEANRDVLSRRLERQGYTVATSEGGQQALEKLRAESFDLVLLDIMMPEMDGYEVLRRLKADEALRHLPVVMISALSEMDSIVRCVELGAEDYLPKPFNPTLLKARIGSCLEKKRARDRETQLFQQLQENYQRLQELEKLRDDLTHMIIHDLRTPLNGVLLGMQALDAVGDLDEAQREMFNIARNSGETLAGMINDLLDVSKMESGSMQLEQREITATSLIGSAMKQVATLANANKLILTTEMAPDLPRFVGDEAKLLRTLVNLLGNALKFTPAGGTVTVAVQPDDKWQSLLFSVSDTGEGIPSEAFGLIFEKFGQVKSRQGGLMVSTGLGLAFCKLAIEAHGGQIHVESKPGLGSTFRFTIPLLQPGNHAG